MSPAPDDRLRGDAKSERPKEFRCRVSFDRPELVGARWWMETQRRLVSSPVAMDRGSKGALTAFAVLAGVGLVAAVCAARCWSSSDDTWTSVTQNSLDAQRERGWDTGVSGRTLEFPGAQTTDSTGRRTTSDTLALLGNDLAPARAGFRPWYVSTLFQSLEIPANTALRQAVRPVVTDSMTAAFDRGTAVRGMFEEPGVPSDIAIVADLPGPEAVAFAAGLAPRFDPVFVFDNWPHPAGVVPAHLTLASALYYRGWFIDHRAAENAPPAFVLDRNRLAPYTDAPDRFDNRYIARLPGADALKAAGVKRILYVVPDGSVDATEMDDLNDPFVALRAAGVEVKVLALSDLRPETVATPATTASPAATSGATGTPGPRTYHYGGHHGGSSWFWHYYAWRAASDLSRAGPAPVVNRGYQYTPTPRATLFSSGTTAGALGGNAVRPRTFGTTTYRNDGGSSSSSGRSGSFGRSGGSSFSG